ncbi:hypothetical protein FKW77_000920 [Venturia effusa]|uniref:Uncharacterized protein n=1 Tax=Venturia effusa TaxID=50376 RepID=A0A517KZ02_9PEZI|nr:hypothetical protein FKW77_000920 [Venturia effusa]
MADIALTVPSPKRPFPKDDPLDDEMPNISTKATSTTSSSPPSSPIDQSSRDVSELPSRAMAAQSLPPTSDPSPSNMPSTNTQKTAPPAKRRKLNPLEKAQEQAEKAAKKEAKEKEKAAKEREKAEAATKKEEDRKKKAEEQEQKRKAKEIESRAKEEEKQRKAAEAEAKKNAREEAKLKKERMKNMRFLPFNVPKQATMAPHNRFLPLAEELARVNEHLDSYFTTTSDKASTNSDDIELSAQITDVLASCKVDRGYVPLPVVDIMDRIHGSSHHAVDLDSSLDDRPETLLQQCTMKYIHFGQDVRPPYCGTWTKPQPLERARQLARNPFQQLLPQLDYDYDSEAEWEEPEEGEDVDSDGEEDEEEGDEDMEGFLDDENPPDYLQGRKGQMSNDLVPVCTGLQWEDASGVLHAADGGQAADFSSLKMGALLAPRPPTIDPFTRAYWEEEDSSVAPPTLKEPGILPGMGLMNPPRVPLRDRPHGFNAQLNGKIPKATKAIKAGRLVSAELLPAFRQEIAGSTMTKLAMLEHLKAKYATFPKCKKDDVNATLVALAQRTGVKANDKRWTLFEDNEK